MPKLTLSADKDVIALAKRLAKERGTSVSAMFSQFVEMAAHATPDQQTKLGPVTRRVKGIAKAPAGVSDKELLLDALLERHG